MDNPNRLTLARRRDDVRPLSSIPQKAGFQIIGIRTDGQRAPLTVFVDDNGNFTVLGYNNLVGWVPA